MDPYQQWLALYAARNQPGANQERLGPLEHGAWSEMMVRENPLWALSLMFATPAYTAGKKLGLLSARSPASIDEMAESYRGIGRGLLSHF